MGRKTRPSKKEIANLTSNEAKRIANSTAARKANTAKAKKENAELWSEFIDIKKRVQELDDLAFKYLTGEIKLTRDQALLMNNLIKIYSEKIIPPAKQKAPSESGKKIVIGLPEDMK